MLDGFEVEGSDIQRERDSHQVLVTPPARISIAEVRDAFMDRLFQPVVARAIVAQLVQAAALLHSRGIIHAGVINLDCTTFCHVLLITISDLHEANILLCLPKPIDDLTSKQLCARYREPHLEQISRLDGRPLDTWGPSHGVIPI